LPFKCDLQRYTAGKSRMQPLGIIVFSCIMGTLGFQILLEGLQQLVGREHTHHLESIYGGEVQVENPV
jgi:divalent metal cation (Fe/Co/Zn/Cd) transporter